MECIGYLVAQVYVPQEYSMPRALRELEELGRILSVNEELRRIAASISIKKARPLARLCERMQLCMAEVKYSCRGSLKPGGLRGFKRQGRVWYGVIKGRVVEVEVLRGRFKVKIGARTRASTINPPVPPSLFTMDIREAMEAIEDSKAVLEGVREVMIG